MGVASRLLPASRVVRSFKREQLSRAYNRLIRVLFGTRLTDTQCGFKAMRRDAARVLLPHVRGDGWFFDAELLILAERNGFRILELPVEWIDDLDSRVVLGSAARELCRELLRMKMRRLPRDLRTRRPDHGRSRREE
jgi:hypothetical protein